MRDKGEQAARWRKQWQGEAGIRGRDSGTGYKVQEKESRTGQEADQEHIQGTDQVRQEQG